MKMKKIGPCKIIRKFEANTYEIELSDGAGISPIFNIKSCILTGIMKWEHKRIRRKFNGLNNFL
jgi:hypothetical protein